MISSNIKKSKVQGVDIRVQGTVQGVGFRPFIYTLATQLKISGTVSNTSAGVLIEAFGSQADLNSFAARIESDAPPLARIISITTSSIVASVVPDSFSIVTSSSSSTSNTAIPADVALCKDCLAELLSPADRRYLYPFINCTNCGPRFTIVETIPYDRPKTSMKVFPMCPACQKEYNDPADRRFHAQPNACARCGPQISWHGSDGSRFENVDPVAEAAVALDGEHVIAIRGLGGFHLVVNALSKEAIAHLRLRKNRPTKPLAVMVANLAVAKKYCHVSSKEKAQLLSPQHPIVLLKRKQNTALAANLCPGVDDIGVMLAYTPLHHLLFHNDNCPEALVMTSGNSSGKPICTTNDAALHQLAHIADFFLLHNREILTRVDDSVGKLINGNFHLFRRARGYSPSPIVLAHKLPQVIGCGAGLKATFCLGRENLAFLSQHIGDLFNLESFDFYAESIEHHKKVFAIKPDIAACDLHPDYMSSQFAHSLDIPVYKVQHHHAHAAAVMAEHGLDGPVLSAVLDGTGYGDDGTVWGGEILLTTLTEYRRLGHLQYLPLPGGDAAATEPWRMAFAALYQCFGRAGLCDHDLPTHLRDIDPQKKEILTEMLISGFNAPPTSSCGRLFDAVAALLGLRLVSDYEGHAAMELEALALKSLKSKWKDELEEILQLDKPSFSLSEHGKWEIISTNFIKMVAKNMAQGIAPSENALHFHFALISAFAGLLQQLARQHNIRRIVLSGGCLQNRVLMEGLSHVLTKANLQVYTGVQVPVNDGGISFGQIIIGGLQHVSRDSHAGNQSGR